MARDGYKDTMRDPSTGRRREIRDADYTITGDVNVVGDLTQNGEAVGGGGITNAAGANVVPKSDGTNLVASRITDDGSVITLAAGTGDVQITSDFGEAKIGHTSNNHLIHLVATGSVTAIDARCDTGGAVVASSTGAFTPAISAIAESSGNGLDAQSEAGYSIWAQSGDSGNTLPTVVAQQRGAATANLFEAQNNGGNPIFAVKSTGDLFIAPKAFADLPATPAEGMIAAITDSSTATWGATIAGGGANNVLAYYNGSNWTVFAA